LRGKEGLLLRGKEGLLLAGKGDSCWREKGTLVEGERWTVVERERGTLVGGKKGLLLAQECLCPSQQESIRNQDTRKNAEISAFLGGSKKIRMGWLRLVGSLKL